MTIKFGSIKLGNLAGPFISESSKNIFVKNIKRQGKMVRTKKFKEGYFVRYD